MASQDVNVRIRASDETRQAFDQVKGNIRGLNTAVSQLRTLFIGNELFQGLSGAAKGVVEARIEFEKLQNTLSQAVGTSRVGTELNFIRTTAQRLGLEFNATANSYAKFAAASRGTALEGQQTRDIFIGISQASAALGLSSEETAGALTAVQQIISKGKVSAEELRGQLGERLPGAFQIAARSIGVTTQQLDSLLASGSLLADDFLPRFGRQLQTEFADAAARAATSTQGSVNRLTSAWNDLKRTLGEGPIGDALTTGIGKTSDELERMNRNLRDSARESKTWVETLLALAQYLPVLGNIARAFSDQNLTRARDSDAFDAITARRAAESQQGVTADTVARLRAFENTQGAAQQRDLLDELRKMRERFQSPEARAQGDIADLQRLGRLTGQDVSAEVAEARRRASAAALSEQKQAEEAARRYVDALQEQVRKLDEVSDVENVIAELRVGGRLRGGTAADLDAALQAAGTKDARRNAELQAEATMRRAQAEEELGRAQEAAAEAADAAITRTIERYRDLADPVKRYRDQLVEIQSLLASGRLDPGTASRAATAVDEQIAKLQDLRREATETRDATRELGLTFESAFEDALINARRLSDVFKGFLQDIARLALRETITRPLFNSLLSAFGPRSSTQLASMVIEPFAEGGVMTARGPLPLRRYAGGGIANTPQVAMWGEGSMPEAFVPLPDGRSIPVTVSGGGPQFNWQVSVAPGATKQDIDNAMRSAVAQAESRILYSMRNGGVFAVA